MCLGTPICKLCCSNGVLQRCCMPAHDRYDLSEVDAPLWHDLHMLANLLQLLLQQHQQLVFFCLCPLLNVLRLRYADTLLWSAAFGGRRSTEAAAEQSVAVHFLKALAQQGCSGRV